MEKPIDTRWAEFKAFPMSFTTKHEIVFLFKRMQWFFFFSRITVVIFPEDQQSKVLQQQLYRSVPPTLLQGRTCWLAFGAIKPSLNRGRLSPTSQLDRIRGPLLSEFRDTPTTPPLPFPCGLNYSPTAAGLGPDS